MLTCVIESSQQIELLKVKPELAKTAFVAKLDFLNNQPILRVTKTWTGARQYYYVDIYSDCNLGFAEQGKEYIFLSINEVNMNESINRLRRGSGFFAEVSKSKKLILRLDKKYPNYR